ncbi:MAG: radical SAM protein [Deltaproteobacteria bacterium]|nr:radical SAM protein [Deltaproteobacteria bacterium]
MQPNLNNMEPILKKTYKVLSVEYKLNTSFIEIDITYKCNLKCINCNRSCVHAPSSEGMSLKQIKKFIQESIKQQRKWKHINILGGEPTLHPGILEILGLLIAYKHNYSPDTSLCLTTNGTGRQVNEILSRVPKEIRIYYSKKNQVELAGHWNFCLAPIDMKIYSHMDFTAGCWIIKECGIGLSRFGFYPCAVAASIDRVFGFDMGRKSLPPPTDNMHDMLNVFCRYCGHFRRIEFWQDRIGHKEKISPAWEVAYKKYKEKPPKMSLY